MQIVPITKLVLVKIAKKNGKYPLKLRVTYNRKQRFYPCNKDLSREEFIKVFQNPKPNRNEKTVKDLAQGIEAKAVNIIKNLKVFDFATFEIKFYEKRNGDGDVYELFTRMYNELMNSDQVGTAIMYNTVMNSLKSYRMNLSFEDITPAFLISYEHWMLTPVETTTKAKSKTTAKSVTTVGIYLRHLRAVYNRGISENLADQEHYPFGRHKYIIPTGNNIKKALTLEEVGRIFRFQTLGSGWERKAKDFWCFSYLCNGMNIMDIAKLKFKDIYDGEIHYERSKTIRTNRGKNNTLISIPILPEAQEVINTWGNTNTSSNNYIFPIITQDMSPVQIKNQVRQFTKNMNKHTKKIATNLDIDKNVTTYVARHSFATVLKRSGATVEVISENLGHKNTNTTKSYLDSFESASRRKNAEALVAFKDQG